MKSKLVHEIRYGLLVLRIRRVGVADSAIHILSIHRLYRNGKLWHESTRFDCGDIPFMRFLLDEAHTWILAQTIDDVESDSELER